MDMQIWQKDVPPCLDQFAALRPPRLLCSRPLRHPPQIRFGIDQDQT